MGLYRRGKVWWMAFTFQGRQIQKSTKTSDRRLAEAILSKVRVKIIEGKYFDILEEKERTFEEMMERYRVEHAAKLASRESIECRIRNMLPFFGHCTLFDITPKLITEYKVKRYSDGVTAATINRELASMKKAFNLAIRDWEWCRGNPVSRVSMEKEPNGRDRWLTQEEEERLLLACPSWLQEIVIFALNSGMRRGEILSLAWEGVDLFRKTVTIFRSKNGERRTIPINQTLLDLLKRKSKVRSLKTPLVFYSVAHTAIDGHNLGHVFRRAVKKAKIANLRFHDLRHTFASRLVQEGVDLYKAWICIRFSGCWATPSLL